ncbi:hypothetical protein Pelo_7769 [Pelomyxa schiedti]|nr:hypothetical protein Pelo_7769 [Pelomyxa schiedti]
MNVCRMSMHVASAGNVRFRAIQSICVLFTRGFFKKRQNLHHVARVCPNSDKVASVLRKHLIQQNIPVHPSTHIIFVDNQPSRFVTDSNSEVFFVKSFRLKNPSENDVTYMSKIAAKLQEKVKQLRYIPCTDPQLNPPAPIPQLLSPENGQQADYSILYYSMH